MTIERVFIKILRQQSLTKWDKWLLEWYIKLFASKIWSSKLANLVLPFYTEYVVYSFSFNPRRRGVVQAYKIGDAAKILGHMASKKAVPFLVQAVRNTSYSQFIGGDVRSVDAKTLNQEIQLEAIGALGKINSKISRAMLEEVILNPHQYPGSRLDAAKNALILNRKLHKREIVMRFALVLILLISLVVLIYYFEPGFDALHFMNKFQNL